MAFWVFGGLGKSGNGGDKWYSGELNEVHVKLSSWSLGLWWARWIEVRDALRLSGGKRRLFLALVHAEPRSIHNEGIAAVMRCPMVAAAIDVGAI